MAAGSVHASELFVSSFGTNQVLGYDTTLPYETDHGNPVITIGAGSPLNGPTGLLFAPNGDLLVGSVNNNAILRFDGQTHAYEGVFANTGSRGGPVGMAYGPDGYLYVVENSGHGGDVSRYNATTGAYVDTLSGGLNYPLSILFDTSGRLYVTDYNNNTVDRFDGTSFTTFANVPLPVGLQNAPDGSILIDSNGYHWIHEFDPTSGNDIGVIEGLGASGAMGYSPEGDLYVSDLGTSGIQKFSFQGGITQSTFVGAFIGGLYQPGFIAVQPAESMTPEPSSLLLGATAVPAIGVAFLKRRRQRHKAII